MRIPGGARERITQTGTGGLGRGGDLGRGRGRGPGWAEGEGKGPGWREGEGRGPGGGWGEGEGEGGWQQVPSLPCTLFPPEHKH